MSTWVVDEFSHFNPERLRYRWYCRRPNASQLRSLLFDWFGQDLKSPFGQGSQLTRPFAVLLTYTEISDISI